jgi:methionine sulfoxide reductase heme-binding subunit
MARTTTKGPATTDARTTKRGGTAVDTWMAEEIILFGRYVKRQTVALWIMGAPAFLPLLFMLPSYLTLNSSAMDSAEADVLGSGSEILLLMTLLITPMVTLTRQRWFVPLRRFYGIMFAATAFTDATTASITTNFAGGVFGRLAGHSFLFVGFIMVMLLIPLFLTANNRAQKWLGRYWKPLHRLIYVIWGLLALHLMLLAGFGIQNGTNGSGPGVDGMPVFHQRFYQILSCSLFLLVLRLPPVKRWVAENQKQGRQAIIFFAFAPLMLLFLIGFAFIVHEELLRGIEMFELRPPSD